MVEIFRAIERCIVLVIGSFKEKKEDYLSRRDTSSDTKWRELKSIQQSIAS